MALGFMDGTRYVRTKGEKTTAPVRLYLKEYTAKDGSTSSYYEGGVQMGNGQWIWVSTGGQLIQKETNTGRTYMNAKVSLTFGGLKGSAAGRKFVTSPGR